MTWLSFGLLVAIAFVAAAEARAVPKGQPLAFMMGPNGAPMLMMRAKRQPAYPHRAMMFTGYYRPTRSDGGPATGVFAQGNAVSGGSYVDNPTYLESGPEPAEDPEIASSEAEAAPQGDFQDEQTYSTGENDEVEPQQVQPQQDELQPYGTEAPLADVPADPQPIPAKRPSKSHKGKKTTVQVNQDEEADDEEEDEDSDDEQSAPFVPFKANRRGQMPNLNNFFPMVFSFPGSYGRKGSSSSGGSPPGMITAIANSYSTGKSGIASSVATAYGGSPNGKKKRSKSAEQ